MVKYWGGVPVAIATGDIYTALQTGVLDGNVQPLAGSYFQQALYEVNKYFINPGFSRGSMCLYINNESWNRIPADLRKLMTDTMVEVETEWIPKWVERKKEQVVRLESLGVKRIDFSEADGKRFAASFYDAFWESLLPKSPQYGPKLRPLAE